MLRKTVLGAAFVFTLAFVLPAYAGKVELTTYYSVPQAEYKDIKTDTLSTGTEQPNRSGDILLRPIAGNPVAWPAGTEGQFAYSSEKDALYHFDGYTWVRQGGFLPKTGQTTSYHADDDGAYRKGWSGSPRFMNNGDGTITDNATGLMWVANPAALGASFSAPVQWANAVANCENLNYAGYTDWRLPNIRELLSLVDYGRTDTVIDPVFTVQGDAFYWSSTTTTQPIGYPECAEITIFGNGGVGSGGGPDRTVKTQSNYVRPVRGG